MVVILVTTELQESVYESMLCVWIGVIIIIILCNTNALGLIKSGPILIYLTFYNTVLLVNNCFFERLALSSFQS
jgi:hypothetical protein